MGAMVSFKEAADRLGICWRHVYRLTKVVDGQVPTDWVEHQRAALKREALARQRRKEAKARAMERERERLKKVRARLLSARRAGPVSYDKARLNVIKSRAVLTPAKVREIRAKYIEGEKQKDLAWMYDVSLPTIQNILSWRSWRHVE